MKSSLVGFLLAMWVLMLIGGGVIVNFLGPISVSDFGEFNSIISSIIKAIIALSLVILWILILLKLKNWLFRKEIKF